MNICISFGVHCTRKKLLCFFVNDVFFTYETTLLKSLFLFSIFDGLCVPENALWFHSVEHFFGIQLLVEIGILLFSGLDDANVPSSSSDWGQDKGNAHVSLDILDKLAFHASRPGQFSNGRAHFAKTKRFYMADRYCQLTRYDRKILTWWIKAKRNWKLQNELISA